jgi:molybdopterin synthase catalytic subunit
LTIRVDRRPLSLARAYSELRDPESGGVAVFVGRVRADQSARGPVTALVYESHREMALEALRSLEGEARKRFGARRIVLWHRLGVLPLGTASVLVGVAAPHRNEAFLACRFLIDRLKADVPIWKTDRGRPEHPPRGRPSRRVVR